MKRFGSPISPLLPALALFFLIPSMMGLLSACRNQAPTHSELFSRLFRSDTAAFRGVDPGDPIEAALRQEDPIFLRHEDELGLSYQFQVLPGCDLLIDYHSDNLRTERQTNRIASIVANLSIEDEVQNAILYQELLDYLNQTYGVASGSNNNYAWEGLTRHLTRMEVHLRMKDNKRGLSLNFVDTEPAPNDSLYSGVELDSMGRPLPVRPPSPISLPSQ